MKQAYEKVPIDFCEWHYRKIELLPECKSVVSKGRTFNYQKARKRFLGIPYTAWVDKNYITFFPEGYVEYYECSCGEDDE